MNVSKLTKPLLFIRLFYGFGAMPDSPDAPEFAAGAAPGAGAPGAAPGAAPVKTWEIY